MTPRPEPAQGNIVGDGGAGGFGTQMLGSGRSSFIIPRQERYARGIGYTSGGESASQLNDHVGHMSIYREFSRDDILRILQMQMHGYSDFSAFAPLLREPYSILRDVTCEVNSALWAATEEAERLRRLVFDVQEGQIDSNIGPYASNLLWFYTQVNHSAPWDIKRSAPWNNTIRTEFPGAHNTPLIFRERLMTPESLGNFTYGYIGAALGLSLDLLVIGSWVADGFSLPSLRGDFMNEFRDWGYVAIGFNAFSRGLGSVGGGCE